MGYPSAVSGLVVGRVQVARAATTLTVEVVAAGATAEVVGAGTASEDVLAGTSAHDVVTPVPVGRVAAAHRP